MAALPKVKELPVRFPQGEIETALTNWWAKEVDEKLDDPFKKGSIYELLPPLDSLRVVQSLLTIEAIIGLPVPEKLVKPGGYKSREEMLSDLLPKLRHLFEKKHK
jgi:hypothetical protein